MKATFKYPWPVLAVAAAIVLLAATLFFASWHKAFGDVQTSYAQVTGSYETYTFFATSTNQTGFATSTSATSTNITAWTNSNGAIDRGYFVTAGAQKVTFFFTRGDTLGTGNTGNSQFRVQVTNKTNPTENDWVYYNALSQNLSTSTSGTLIGQFAAPAGTSTLIGSLQYGDEFYAVRCIAVRITDGDDKCAVSASF
jgi:hypothetical protein